MFFNLQGFGNLVGLCFLILVFIYNSVFTITICFLILLLLLLRPGFILQLGSREPYGL